ncbi:ABC transporter permease [Lactobacillus intestinalis]|uniref:ABC transporter permease n=2 Tax=Lactobacillus intestinalis TaxID=151781 RepID=A0ABR5PT00_9LACO|nr:ABC transporter permease [Lactobacillus intestinalis]KRM34675.1 ABC transporter permease [Lactobacillus intestinalis DSM 6629]
MQFRVPIAVFFSLIFPIIMMVTMLISYGNFSIGNGLHFIDKYFLVSISIGILPLALISFPIWVSENIQSKVLERLQYLGVNTYKLMIADLLSYLILAILEIFFNILVARILFNLSIPNFQYVLAFFIQSIYCIFVLFVVGLSFAIIIPNTRVIMPLGMIIMFLTYMFIGVFVRFNELPKKIINISNYLPIKYMTNNFFSIWTGRQLWNGDFLKLNTLWMIITVILTLLVYKFKYRGVTK